MGWHLKCVLCEKEEKHGLSCECYVKEAHRNALKMKGCTILESVLSNEQYTFIDLY